MLHRIPVKAGDFVFVDGGVPHAIGGGCFMVELQEPSDLMVVAERFTPSGRRIPDAKLSGGHWGPFYFVYDEGESQMIANESKAKGLDGLRTDGL